VRPQVLDRSGLEDLPFGPQVLLELEDRRDGGLGVFLAEVSLQAVFAELLLLRASSPLPFSRWWPCFKNPFQEES